VQNESGKVAFVFPGIGVAPCGYEADFYSRHQSQMRPFFEHASELAGVDLAEAATNGGAQDLGHRANELFTCAFSCAGYAVYASLGFTPSCVAGYSLGVYSALFASGALSFADSLKIAVKAHILVQDVLPEGEFGMGIVVGLRGEEVEQLLQESGDEQLCVANTNSATAYVLAGRRDTLALLLDRAETLGALRTSLLTLDVPFHNPHFLGKASSDLTDFLGGFAWASPACPVVSSIDQRLLVTPDQLIAFTALNLSTPIHWLRVTEALAGQDVRMVIECGPGISLTQNARFIAGSPRHTSVQTSKRRLGV